MSGGPPHHPHNRQVPPANTAWNHLQSLQVPNFFPRQPQLAHMSGSEHSLMHQPTWHTPTTTEAAAAAAAAAAAMKMHPHHTTHMLTEMLKSQQEQLLKSQQEHLFPRDCVDLSLSRNGNQNGELNPTPTPISLSVRDTNKINSLPPSALEIQAVELTKCTSPGLKSSSPGLKSTSPGLKSLSPGLKSTSPGLKSASPGLKSASPGLKVASPGFKAASPGMMGSSPSMKPVVSSGFNSSVQSPVSPGHLKPTSPGGVPPQLFPVVHQPAIPHSAAPTEITKCQQKRANVRVDSILERLNPTPERVVNVQENRPEEQTLDKLQVTEKPASVIEKAEKPPTEKPVSVIIQPTSSFDDNSNSSSILNTPKDEDTVSTYSNEDSLDSNKSRRKRKPSKTVRVSKEEGKATPSPEELDHPETDKEAKEPIVEKVEEKKEPIEEKDPVRLMGEMLEAKEEDEEKEPEKTGGSSDEFDELLTTAAPSARRKHSSESETIDNIAAMVQEGLKEKQMISSSSTGVVSETSSTAQPIVPKEKEEPPEHDPPKPVETQQLAAVTTDAKPMSVSVIKTKENLAEVLTSDVPTVPAPAGSALAVPAPAANVAPDASEPTTTIATTTTMAPSIVTPAQKKATNTHFVEVENKLEEMFAGIEDSSSDPFKTEPGTLDALDDSAKLEESLLKLDESESEQHKPAPEKDEKENATAAPAAIPSPKQEESVSTPTPAVKSEAETAPKASVEAVTVTSSTEVQKRKAPATPKKAKRKSRSVSMRDDEETAGEPKLKRKKMSKTKAELKKTPTTTPTKTTATKTTPKKQGQNQKQSAKSATDSVKDVYAYDSGSNASSSRSRGPFIHIRGPRDSPISVSVVNTPISEEDGERRPAKVKKFHDDSEYRHKVRSKGLHCSTLSTKYDAQTRDTSWICAFCKRGPHASELSGPTTDGPAMGDLFGPYFITSQCPEFERRLDDPFDRHFKSKKVSRALDEQQEQARASKKAKRKHSDGDRTSESESDIYLGIHETTSAPSTSRAPPTSSEPSYEVWAHEDCIVWSPGTYLVGARLVGLEEAVWQACGVPCSLCKLRGATVCCLRRGCVQRTHVPCARRLEWKMDEEGGFKAWCVEHAT